MGTTIFTKFRNEIYHYVIVVSSQSMRYNWYVKTMQLKVGYIVFCQKYYTQKYSSFLY